MNQDRDVRRATAMKSTPVGGPGGTSKIRSVPPAAKTATKVHAQLQKTGSKQYGGRKKLSTPTATKSGLGMYINETRGGRGELDGLSIPRPLTMQASNHLQRAARKLESTHRSHAKPVDGRFYIKNGQLKRIESDEDSDSSMEDMYALPQDPPRTLKAARKIEPSSDSSNLARKTGKPLKAARKPEIEPIYVSSSSEESDPPESDEDHSDLIAAFGLLTIPTRLRIHKCLPFLLRNLRAGFRAHCVAAGISTYPRDKPKTPVRIVYRYHLQDEHSSESSDSDDDWEEEVGESYEWECPICDLHGVMSTRSMVVYHLQRDHTNAESLWEDLGDKWQVTITPRPPTEISQPPGPDSEDTRVTPPSDIASFHALDARMTGRDHKTITVEAHREVTPVQTMINPSSPSMSVRHKHEIEDEIDAAILAAARQSTPFDQRCSGINEDGTLIPPPKEDPLGPAAQHPFLNGDMISCRIGGPRLYDLLQELDLDEFGVVAWSIVDREEEIYDLEDIRDEDKVMLALWNRWILLNRTKFVFEGYFQGMKSFINRYYAMIHRAAGWAALRMFLLLFKANRFLSLQEIKQVLRFYEEKVDMDNWYKDTETQVLDTTSEVRR